jgi:hypothetical protein
MDLPDEKGTYVLIASMPQMKRLEIGHPSQEGCSHPLAWKTKPIPRGLNLPIMII